MIAIIPIVPVLLYPLITIVGGMLVSLAAIFGLSRDREKQRVVRRFLWGQRFSLLVLLGLAVAGWYSLDTIWNRWLRPRPIPVDIVSGDDWPLFRGTALRAGVHDPQAEVSLQSPLWFGGVNDSFYASPAIVGNRVFCVGSSGDKGRIYCWEKETGGLQWVIEPPGMRATFSSPVVVGNSLLCGEGLHRTALARVFCFDISEAHQASLQWQLTTNSHVECTPVVVGDRVYVAAGDDGVYALALRGTRDGQPVVHWHLPGDQLPDVETALVADSQRVIVGTGEGGQSVVILDAETGRELTRQHFDFPIYAPPALVGDHVYLGMGNGNFVDAPADGRGAVAAMNVVTGQVMWTLPVPATVLGAIVFDRNEMVFGSADGVVRVVSPSGTILRTWDAGSAVNASLAVTSNRICGVTSRGRLFVLDRQSMSLIAERSLGAEGYFISSPTIVEDRVLLGTEHAGLQCLGPAR